MTNVIEKTKLVNKEIMEYDKMEIYEKKLKEIKNNVENIKNIQENILKLRYKMEKL